MLNVPGRLSQVGFGLSTVGLGNQQNITDTDKSSSSGDVEAEPGAGDAGMYGRGDTGTSKSSKPFQQVCSQEKQRNESSTEAEYDVKGGPFFKEEMVEQV